MIGLKHVLRGTACLLLSATFVLAAVGDGAWKTKARIGSARGRILMTGSRTRWRRARNFSGKTALPATEARPRDRPGSRPCILTGFATRRLVNWSGC